MNKAGQLAKTRKHSLTPGRQVDGGGGCHPSWQLSYLQRHRLNSFFSYMWSVIHSGNLPEQPTMCRSMLSPALNSWDCSFDLTSSSVTGPCSYCKAHVSLASQAKSKDYSQTKQLAREPHVICKSVGWIRDKSLSKPTQSESHSNSTYKGFLTLFTILK